MRSVKAGLYIYIYIAKDVLTGQERDLSIDQHHHRLLFSVSFVLLYYLYHLRQLYTRSVDVEAVSFEN